MSAIVLWLAGSTISNALAWLVVAPRVFRAPRVVPPTVRRVDATRAAGTCFIDLQAGGSDPFIRYNVPVTLAGGPMDGERFTMPSFAVGALDPRGRGEYVREDRGDGSVILHWEQRVA